MNRKLIICIVFIAAVVGTASYLYVRWKGECPATTLDINGNIEAHESVVGFKVQGRLVELPVEEGQEVKAGDLLAKLDQSDYRQQVDIDEASARTREKELKLALAGSRIQDKKSAEQAILDAKADLELKGSISSATRPSSRKTRFRRKSGTQRIQISSAPRRPLSAPGKIMTWSWREPARSRSPLTGPTSGRRASRLNCPESGWATPS